DVFRENFSPLAKKLNLVEWEITDSAIKPKVIIMVSQQDHCLADLLQRWHSGEMDFQLCAVISNHDKFQSFVEWHNIPFHHAPLEDIKLLLAHYKPDTIVLARYMQILPPDICTDYAGRIINIHHSFLPSFSGARPYHQAHALGVKLIGATCHYVTPVLDAGPIIEQDLIRVAHSDSIDDMVRLGRDIEKMVLARGLHYHLHNRVLLNQQKTIVFR
ncbi:MAG: formyltetrahydrofolate deformylase, partial [Gammaproteobacteria bacterium]